MAVDFDDWYRQTHASVERALRVMSGDREVAQDLCDEAFARALERWDRVSAMDSPSGWVRTVAVNLLRRHERRRRVERAILRRERPRHEQPEEVHPDLWSTIQTLPDRQREAIALRYVSDLTESEVAAAMGVTPGAASATLSAARLRLAALLQPTRSEENTA